MEIFSVEMSQLISQTANLSCYEDVLSLEPDCVNDAKATKLSLVGKLITDRDINFHATKTILTRAWNINEGLSISYLDGNIFPFNFTKEVDQRRAVNSGPWPVMGAHLVLKAWLPNLVLEEIDFSLSPSGSRSTAYHQITLPVQTRRK
ncbi:hypothetical protein L1049_014034 [Liquidambar formosana]|uniref:DUF4283 domain-containing protein n=1 Tax=Liquidambar formosana TaxID=63359 RepID=A0AAP0WXB6_LIQFO